jgi:hypothetical protein
MLYPFSLTQRKKIILTAFFTLTFSGGGRAAQAVKNLSWRRRRRKRL